VENAGGQDWGVEEDPRPDPESLQDVSSKAYDRWNYSPRSAPA
jgi:hypothetical protein